MVSVFTPAAILAVFLLFAAPSSSLCPDPRANSSAPANIVAACKASRDPQFCEQALVKSGLVPPRATARRIMRSVLNLTSQNLDTVKSMAEEILAGSSGNPNRTQAANYSLLSIGFSIYRVGLTVERGLHGDRIKDGRAWLSAALAYQYDGMSSFRLVNDTADVINTIAFFNETVIPTTSTALSMLANYDIHRDDTASWGPPRTERDGFWEPAEESELDFDGGVPKGLTPNATVCSECQYKRVQSAVDAAPELKPDDRFVIMIKAGVYNETVRVPLNKLNVVMLGDGIGQTVITGSLKVGQPNMTTFESATVGVLGDGFMASNITFENTGTGSQAVAFRSDADHTVVENCEFRGNQDTLYAKAMRQFYTSCQIEGNVDFFFGNAAAFFKDCEILIVPRSVNPEKGETNAVAAVGRNDPGMTTGFVFHNCSINGTEEYMKLYNNNPEVHKNYLGRPWKEYSRTVFIRSDLGEIISKDGWLPWQGDFALSTLYYAEFANRGPGSNTSARVTWSSNLPAEHVKSYSVHNFIQGDRWIPKSN